MKKQSIPATGISLEWATERTPEPTQFYLYLVTDAVDERVIRLLPPGSQGNPITFAATDVDRPRNLLAIAGCRQVVEV